jgi:hypothetical protein
MQKGLMQTSNFQSVAASLERYKSIATKIAVCQRVHKGAVAPLNPRFSRRNIENGFALFGGHDD